MSVWTAVRDPIRMGEEHGIRGGHSECRLAAADYWDNRLSFSVSGRGFPPVAKFVGGDLER